MRFRRRLCVIVCDCVCVPVCRVCTVVSSNESGFCSDHKQTCSILPNRCVLCALCDDICNINTPNQSVVEPVIESRVIEISNG